MVDGANDACQASEQVYVPPRRLLLATQMRKNQEDVALPTGVEPTHIRLNIIGIL